MKLQYSKKQKKKTISRSLLKNLILQNCLNRLKHLRMWILHED